MFHPPCLHIQFEEPLVHPVVYRVLRVGDMHHVRHQLAALKAQPATRIYWLMWAHGSHQKEMQIKATALWSQLLFSLRPIKMEEKQNAQTTDRLLVLLFLCGCEGLVVLSATTTATAEKGWREDRRAGIESLFSLQSYRLWVFKPEVFWGRLLHFCSSLSAALKTTNAF